MKKVMIIANDTTYTYNLRNEIIEKLIENNYEVVVVATILNKREELEELGCKLINIETNRHAKNPFNDLVLMNQYKKIIKKEAPSLVLTYNIKPNVYGGMACQLTKTPYMPNITGLGTAVEYPGMMQVLASNLYKIGVRKAQVIFFQNSENLDFFRSRKMIAKNTETVLLPGSGVSLKMHKPLEYPKDDNTINLFFIARILKEKGIDLYLDSARRISKEFNNVKFHICGYCDDDRYISLIDRAEKDGDIIYHGEQTNMIPFFEMAHCIVHPSYYPEGMSNVLLEAAAHCRPIIATDRSGCRETVEDGITGYLIPIKDEEALYAAIRRFLLLPYDEKKQMGLNGRHKIETEFDRQLVADAYISAINRVFII